MHAYHVSPELNDLISRVISAILMGVASAMAVILCRSWYCGRTRNGALDQARWIVNECLSAEFYAQYNLVGRSGDGGAFERYRAHFAGRNAKPGQRNNAFERFRTHLSGRNAKPDR